MKYISLTKLQNEYEPRTLHEIIGKALKEGWLLMVDQHNTFVVTELGEEMLPSDFLAYAVEEESN